MTAELEELAETVEAFYEDATRFRMVVERYEQGNVNAERVAYDDARHTYSGTLP